jgi:hypothetical protein
MPKTTAMIATFIPKDSLVDREIKITETKDQFKLNRRPKLEINAGETF